MVRGAGLIQFIRTFDFNFLILIASESFCLSEARASCAEDE